MQAAECRLAHEGSGLLVGWAEVVTVVGEKRRGNLNVVKPRRRPRALKGPLSGVDALGHTWTTFGS